MKFLMGIGVAVMVLWSLSFAHGQRETERYIPVGKSPGLSDRYTYIGMIETADLKEQTLSVAGSSGTRIVKITNRTKIWLDRSKLKLTNLKGSSEDLQKGRRVEVKFEDDERKESAEWIKVEITEAGTGRGAPRK